TLLVLTGQTGCFSLLSQTSCFRERDAMVEQPFKDVSDKELAVLQVLWDRGPSTIGQVTDALYPEGTDANYASVQVFLNRLEVKGHVRRDRTGHAHVFHA